MMYYDEPIDRYHSQPFSYHAETDSLALQKLSQNIWKSFKDEDRTNIDGTSNNKGKILGQDYLRLTIIQLFAHWKSDPTMCLATPRGNDTLNVKDFYNTKMVSIRKLSKVFDALNLYGYVDHVNHTHTDNPENKNTTSRIRTNKRLHDLFIEVDACEFDVDLNADAKLIHLTDWEIDEDGDLVKDANNKKAKQYIKYDENEPHIAAKLKVLLQYNQLLRQTHVDVASLEQPYVIRLKKNKTTKKIEEQLIPINQNKKFVRRIFSRGDWEANGRFYGGFWQQIGSEYRHHLRINGHRTVELDYSSLHPNILLVEQGNCPCDDVYSLGTEPILPRFDLLSPTGKKLNKMMLGDCKGGEVHLGGSGETLVVSEGIENGLSAKQMLPINLGTFVAAMSATNVGNLKLPTKPATLIIAADDDQTGMLEAKKLGERASGFGWEASMLPPPAPGDWNDYLQRGD